MSSAVGTVARWISPFLQSWPSPAWVVSPPGTGVSRPGDTAGRRRQPAGGGALLRQPRLEGHARGERRRSPELTAIANTPTAYWMDHLSTPAVDAKYIADAQAAGTMPILALYGIPHRDCGSFAAGGFGSGRRLRGWIDGVAAAIGGGPAAIILEPDALAMADCLSGDQRQERFDLMSYAVDTLTRNPATAVYVDAGHSRWVNADEMANRLNQVGVAKARGFSLNTANFFTTEEEIGYGDAISGMTGGKPYVIDTSRNGAGPVDGECTGATPAVARWAPRRPPRPGTGTSTPFCG